MSSLHQHFDLTAHMYLHMFSLAAAGTSCMNVNHNDCYVKVKSKILNARERKHPANCLIIQK